MGKAKRLPPDDLAVLRLHRTRQHGTWLILVNPTTASSPRRPEAPAEEPPTNKPTEEMK